MKCMFIVGHGSGCQFMSTVIARELAEKYEEVYTISNNKYFFDVLAIENPKIHSCGFESLQAMYSSVMQDKANWDVVADHVYNTSDFILKKSNWYDGFRKLLGLPLKNDWDENGTKTTPYLEAVPQQIKDAARQYAQEHPNFVLFQRAGGQNPVGGPMQQTPQGPQRAPWNEEEVGLRRKYPMDKSVELVRALTSKGYEVLQYHLPNEAGVEGAIRFQQEQNQLVYYELSKYAKGVVTIDSSLQHLCAHNAAKKMVVIWVQTPIVGFGYSDATNICKQTTASLCPNFAGIPDSPIVNYPEVQEVLDACLRVFDKPEGNKTEDDMPIETTRVKPKHERKKTCDEEPSHKGKKTWDEKHECKEPRNDEECNCGQPEANLDEPVPVPMAKPKECAIPPEEGL